MRGRWRDRVREIPRDHRLRGAKCPWSKLTEEDVATIRADQSSSVRALAARLGRALDNFARQEKRDASVAQPEYDALCHRGRAPARCDRDRDVTVVLETFFQRCPRCGSRR
jgi:hypothetical protein